MFRPTANGAVHMDRTLPTKACFAWYAYIIYSLHIVLIILATAQQIAARGMSQLTAVAFQRWREAFVTTVQTDTARVHEAQACHFHDDFI